MSRFCMLSGDERAYTHHYAQLRNSQPNATPAICRVRISSRYSNAVMIPPHILRSAEAVCLARQEGDPSYITTKSAFHQLPVEIVQIIVLALQTPLSTATHPSSRQAYPWLRLMMVCRLWYVAIESYPRLWTTFVLPDISPLFFKLLLRRSQQLPLFVSFQEPALGDPKSPNHAVHARSVQMLHQLFARPERIRAALVTFRSTTVYNSFAELCWYLGPNLRSLNVETSTIELLSRTGLTTHPDPPPSSNELWLRCEKLTGLRELRVFARALPTSMEIIGRITSLVVLEIRQVGVDMGQVLPCLAGLPSLEMLRVESAYNLFPWPSDVDHSSERVLPTAQMYKLQMCYLSCHPDLCTQLTTHLRAPPSLRLTLDYHTWGAYTWDSLDISSSQMVAPLLPLLHGYNILDLSIPVRALSLEHTLIPDVVMLNGWTQAASIQLEAASSPKPSFSIIQPDIRGDLSTLVQELPLEDVEVLIIEDVFRELHRRTVPEEIDAWPKRMPRLLELRLTMTHQSVRRFRLLLDVLRCWLSESVSRDAGMQTELPWPSLQSIIIGGFSTYNLEVARFVNGLQAVLDRRAEVGPDRQSKILVRIVRDIPKFPFDDGDNDSLDSARESSGEAG